MDGTHDGVRATASPSRALRLFSFFSPFGAGTASIRLMNDASHPAAEYRFLDWRYEPARRRLVGPDGETRLKPLSDRLLRCLLDAPGTVRARDQLIEEVWTRREVNDEVLSRAIAELRALLGDDARQPRFVETLSKGGYRWIAPVTRIDAAPVRESIRVTGAIQR